ncbi:MAG: hypothetical protein GX024_01450 [Clostridiales bacterium]|jgi:hypothetical protein|nr:hypothetical protein [Clostridiales bacterium]
MVIARWVKRVFLAWKGRHFLWKVRQRSGITVDDYSDFIAKNLRSAKIVRY